MSDVLPNPIAAIVTLMDALNCGALLMTHQGRIMHANVRLAQMLGRDPGELHGQDLRTIYQAHPDGVAFIEQRLADPTAAYEGEFFVPATDGSRRPVVISGRDLSEQPGVGLHRLVTVIDITEQKEAEYRAEARHREVARLSDAILQQAINLKHQAEKLAERVRERTTELREANMEAIYMLAVASELRDSDTGEHVRRIHQLTRALALQLGVPEDTAERFGYSAVLHDVGKIQVPDEILKKPGPLTAEERTKMESHTIAGCQILSKKRFFNTARQIARSHHERWDGQGYPDRLAGESIPFAARIVALADVYDALTHTRIYKGPWPADTAARTMREGSGTQFDPEVVAAFEALRQARTIGETASPGGQPNAGNPG